MILNASSNNVEANTVELLWEQNPIGTMSSGHSVNVCNMTTPMKYFVPSEYDILYVVSYSTSDKKEAISTFPILPGIDGTQQFFVYNGKYCYHRSVTVNANGVTFGAGARVTLGGGTASSDAKYAVPYRIYGVRYRGDDSE